MKLSGNTILITGGATGIGLALAEQFLSAQNEVIIIGRREQKLKEVKAKYPSVHTIVCDVADKSSQQSLFEQVTTAFPKINVLINNAGIQRDIDLTSGLSAITDGESEIDINFTAPVLLTGLFLPHLLKQENPVIINVTSGLAFTPMPGVPLYCATKAALHTYTLLLRHQLLKTGTKVFEVIPPMVDTELNAEGRKKRNSPYRGISTAEYISAVMKGFEQDTYEIYYGQTADAMKLPRTELENRLLNMGR